MNTFPGLVHKKAPGSSESKMVKIHLYRLKHDLNRKVGQEGLKPKGSLESNLYYDPAVYAGEVRDSE